MPPRAANLSFRFWVALVLTGIGAGLGAMAMMALLRAVEHAVFAYHHGSYSAAAAAHSHLRLVVVLLVGGLVAGLGWWFLREHAGGTGGEPTTAVWEGHGDLSLSRTVASGALSEVVIGMGASLGREAAPQHTGAAFGSWFGHRLGLPAEQRVLLVACGAGAGVGAVYNVPLAGALFAAELYLGSLSLTTVVPALATSTIATAVSWITLPARPVYLVPHLPYPSLSLVMFCLVAGPLIGLTSAGYVRMIGWASDHRPHKLLLIVEPILAFGILGLLAIEYPLLLGNGLDLAQFAFTGKGFVFLTLAALIVLKPLVTSMCLRSGASGGLFTPTFSFGAVLGALLGQAWLLAWPGPGETGFAVVGATAMLAAAMESPLAAVAFTVELTNTVNASMVALVLAVVGAVVVGRRFEMRSIYSARVARPQEAAAVAGARGGRDSAG